MKLEKAIEIAKSNAPQAQTTLLFAERALAQERDRLWVANGEPSSEWRAIANLARRIIQRRSAGERRREV